MSISPRFHPAPRHRRGKRATGQKCVRLDARGWRPVAPVCDKPKGELPQEVPVGGPQGEVARADTAFVGALAQVLQHLCRPATVPCGTPTSFDGVRPPPISLPEYIERIRAYIPCSTECFVLAIVYIDRVLQTHPTFVVSQLNVHRLFITALVVACKFHDDFYFSNKYYSVVAGVSNVELNALEAKFCKLLSWKLFVKPDEYEHYHQSVLKAATQAGEPWVAYMPSTGILTVAEPQTVSALEAMAAPEAIAGPALLAVPAAIAVACA